MCVLRLEVVECDCIRRAWGRTTEKHSVTNLCRTCMVSILSHYAGQRKRRTASVGWIPSHGSALLWPPPLMNNLSSRSTQISCLRKKSKGIDWGREAILLQIVPFGTPASVSSYLRFGLQLPTVRGSATAGAGGIVEDEIKQEIKRAL